MTIQSMDKAMSRSNANSFELVDITEGVQRKTGVRTGILTAMFSGGESNSFYNTTDRFQYDEMIASRQLPQGKSSDGYGPDLKKDKALERTFRGGHFGFRYNIAPTDVKGKRKPFTNEIMTVEDHIADMTVKADQAWVDFSEISFAQLLTQDTNYLGGSDAIKQYNYHTEIEGGARAAAVTMNLAANLDVWLQEQGLIDQLQEEVEKAGTTHSNVVCICGSGYFDKRYALERQDDLAREKRGPLDLASMSIPRDGFGVEGGVFQNRYFTSDISGITFIRMSASIVGTRLVGVEDAYLLPTGTSELFARAFAPVDDMEYVNTVALERYAFMEENRKKGLTFWEEQNVLYINRKPKLIIKLTSAA
jgi:hypothetical protein